VPPAQVECKIDSGPTYEQERVNKYDLSAERMVVSDSTFAKKQTIRTVRLSEQQEETKDIARQQNEGAIERKDIARQQNKGARERESEQARPYAGNDEAKHDWAGNKPNHQLGSTFPANSTHVNPCMFSGVKQASWRCT